ncbi:MAG: hypothetical protein U1F41_13435 [Burkholderiales bacterium]
MKRLLFLLSLSVILGTSPSRAADSGDSSSQKENGWHFYLPTYLWAAGARGTTSTLPGIPAGDLDVSFSDSLKDLDIAVVTTMFAHKDRLLFLVDLSWSRLSPTQSATFKGNPIELKFSSEAFTLTGAAGYRLVNDPSVVIDAYAGAKYWYMDNSASVEPAVVTPSSIGRTESWVDGVVGGQILYNLTDQVYVGALGFVGAGGSKIYGDIYGGVGYRIDQKWELFAGYRAQRVERENDQFLYMVTQYGPLVGFGARF